MSTTASEIAAEWEELFDDSLQECRWAISAEYYDVPGRMDIRRLWSRDGVHYFRVNWWKLRQNLTDQYIWRSLFVAVEETETSMVVRETTANLAA